MSEEHKYKCPHCGCEDRIGHIESFTEPPVEWQKMGNEWKEIQPTTDWVGDKLYYCPKCHKILPRSAWVEFEWEKIESRK